MRTQEEEEGKKHLGIPEVGNMPDNPRILVVDDEIAVLNILRSVLEKKGYDVKTVLSGEDALAEVETDTKIDLILLDVMMPDLDGFEVLRMIKDDPTTADTCVIMLTVAGQVTDKVRAFSAGASDYIMKPFKMPELMARIETQLKVLYGERELQRAHEELEEKVRERTAELLAANAALKKEAIEREAAEKALRKSVERYKDLVDHASVAIAIDDREGNVVFCNETLADIFGYPEEEMTDTSHLSLVHPDDREAVSRINRKRMQGEDVPSRYEFKGIRNDGTTIYLEVAVSKILKEGDRITGTRAYLWDITKRRMAEERSRKEEEKRRNVVINTAHLLHTPLTIIRANLDLARRGGKELTPELYDRLLAKLDEMKNLISGELFAHIELMTVETSDGLTRVDRNRRDSS